MAIRNKKSTKNYLLDTKRGTDIDEKLCTFSILHPVCISIIKNASFQIWTWSKLFTPLKYYLVNRKEGKIKENEEEICLCEATASNLKWHTYITNKQTHAYTPINKTSLDDQYFGRLIKFEFNKGYNDDILLSMSQSWVSLIIIIARLFVMKKNGMLGFYNRNFH